MNADRPDPRGDEHDDLPCWVALVAGSMALMSAHAAPEATARICAQAQRRLMARKIVSNLFFLRHHPHAPPGVRHVAARMQDMWVPLAQDEPGADAAPGPEHLPKPPEPAPVEAARVKPALVEPLAAEVSGFTLPHRPVRLH
ncbi:MAG: hypothetical protein HZC37_15020 [Burkholderiales bacterium]|nr:hypothetical protein [Burkholderiales bacterium]